jgi:3-oxoacyl-[acyl-carrier-protein] synthase II
MSEMATLAALEATAQAKLQFGNHAFTPRVALCIGSTIGSPENLETHYRKLIERGGPEGQLGTTFFKVMNHTVMSNVAAALEFYGPATGPSSACATSGQAIGLAWELLQTGLYDIVIAGGADELHYTGVAVFDTVLAASRGYHATPELASRPFDAKRDGLVVSEGAGIVVLETEESAKRRGLKALSELKGAFYTCDGTHMSQTQAGSMADTMKAAMERAKVTAKEVDYVNAHATSTLIGDEEEAQAIFDAVGSEVPVSSLKGHLGHSLAACGALEVISCVKMMQNGVLIPTRNLENIDPKCAKIRHLQKIEPLRAKTILSNNFAFGGINSTLVLSSVR